MQISTICSLGILGLIDLHLRVDLDRIDTTGIPADVMVEQGREVMDF